MTRLVTVLGCAVCALALTLHAAEIERTASTPGATVYVIGLENGATVSSPLVVRFGLRGMGVAPAGVDLPGTGHHHLVIDAPTPPLDVPLPADDHHRHFGGGQTEVELELPPGEHTLQLVLADKIHLAHEPPVLSEVIKIRVK